MKVALLGAAGLVGQVVLERFLHRPDIELVPCVRNPANAWPLIRLGIEPFRADLQSLDELRSVLKSCSHVVNCAWGDDRQSITSMKNLLQACRETGVHRLVHLSSVAVYGDPPSPDSVTESGHAAAGRGSYGWYKRRQDDLAEAAHGAAMQVAILCIPHVTGPRSRFLLGLVRQLRGGHFAFVDGGRHPVVLADSANVAQAIERALEVDGVDGRRMFVNDGPPVSWKSLVGALAPLAEVDPGAFPDLRADEVRRGRERKIGLMAAARQIIDVPEVRSILRRTAVANSRLAMWTKKIVKRRLANDNSRSPAGKPAGHSRQSIPPPGAWLQQMRMVPHSCERARHVLGYTPEVDFETSMAAFIRWYGVTSSYGTPTWLIAESIEKTRTT